MERVNFSKQGFTLVELLIVIMIIAILAGMMLLASGSSINGAEASKVINDLRDIKMVVMFYHMDTHNWPLSSSPGAPLDSATVASLDKYMDGRTSGFAATRYTGIYTLQNSSNDRIYIGLGLMNNNATDGVRKKISVNAEQSGLYEDDSGTPYSGTGSIVYMHLK